MKYQEIKVLIQKKEAKLRLAEKNYKETHSDCFLIEQHSIKAEIKSLKVELESSRPSEPVEHEAERTAEVPAFVTPADVEQLPSSISKHILRIHGNAAIEMPLEKLAVIQSELLGVARKYYEEQNDTDAVSRVDEMLSKIQSRLAGDPKDAENTEDDTGDNGDCADKATETPSNDTKEQKPTDVPKPQKKANGTQKKGTGSKNKGKK